MGKPIDPQDARKKFLEAGLKPLEPFPGAKYRWKSECLSCKSSVEPWYTSVANKGLGGCKYCGVEKSKNGKRGSDLRKAHAILLKANLSLLSIYEGVKAKSLLKCNSCGIVFRTTIDSFRSNRVCPCSRTPKPPRNPLSQANPNLSEQWHHSKNGDLKPSDVSKSSHLKAWWECQVGHEWQAAIYSRHSGKGCPVCSGRSIVTGINDLQTMFPEVAKEWDMDLNLGLNPNLISPGSNLSFWWRCLKDSSHVWSTSATKRTHAKTGCPECARDKFTPGINDLKTLRPDLMLEWDFSKNQLDPGLVYICSDETFHWEGDCGHSWTQRLSNRLRGFGCTVCSGKRVEVGVNDLASQFPEIARYFHPHKNPLPPEEYIAGSGLKVWWFCDAGHEYESLISNKTRLNTGCPICSNQLLVPGVNDLATAFPELLDRWDFAKNSNTPDKFLKSSKTEAWWRCEKGHSFSSTLRSMHLEKCPICVGRQVLEGETDLATVRPDLAAQWNYELNSKSPKEVTLGSDYLAWWKDDSGHEWNQRVQSRSRGVGCPECAQVGFSSLKPGIFYYIHHPGYHASKVGITNTGIKSDRLAEFKKAGWTVLETWEFSDGYLVRKIETSVLHWIRKTLGIPPFLTLFEMPKTGGWSETFSHDAVEYSGIKAIVEREVQSERKSG